jgi:hypothetical protein
MIMIMMMVTALVRALHGTYTEGCSAGTLAAAMLQQLEQSGGLAGLHIRVLPATLAVVICLLQPADEYDCRDCSRV